jgi:hypothetical protein
MRDLYAENILTAEKKKEQIVIIYKSLLNLFDWIGKVLRIENHVAFSFLFAGYLWVSLNV